MKYLLERFFGTGISRKGGHVRVTLTVPRQCQAHIQAIASQMCAKGGFGDGPDRACGAILAVLERTPVVVAIIDPQSGGRRIATAIENAGFLTKSVNIAG